MHVAKPMSTQVHKKKPANLFNLRTHVLSFAELCRYKNRIRNWLPKNYHIGGGLGVLIGSRRVIPANGIRGASTRRAAHWERKKQGLIYTCQGQSCTSTAVLTFHPNSR